MEQQPDELSAVLDGLFASERTTMTTSTGVAVEFKRAGIKQLGQATRFFGVIMDRAPADKVKEFLELVSGAQQKLMDEGKSVYDMNLNAEGMLSKAINNQSLLLTVFAAVADVIPEFVTIFATISEEEYEALELDEQLVIVAGVFIVNYGFFTQKLPPIIKSVMLGLSQKKSEISKVGNTAKAVKANK